MGFMPALIKPYDAAGPRSLLETPFLEIENPFKVSESLFPIILEELEANGLVLAANYAGSIYGDTSNLGVWRNGKSFRLRPGGQALVSKGGLRVLEVYEDAFSMKGLNAYFQAVVDEIATRIHPEMRNFGVNPLVRDETEGKHPWPDDAAELRFGDIPYSQFRHDGHDIGNVIERLIAEGKIEGVYNRNDLVIKPMAITTVDRELIKMYFDPRRPVDFRSNWPVSEPTPSMRWDGIYMCLEMAADECMQWKPKAGVHITKMIEDCKTKSFGDFKYLGKDYLTEFEAKTRLCGPGMTNELLVRGYMEFLYNFTGWAARLGGCVSMPNVGVFINPTNSKAANTIGALEECRPGGRLYATYIQGLAIGH